MKKKKKKLGPRMRVEFRPGILRNAFGVFIDLPFITRSFPGSDFVDDIATIEDTKKYPKEWKKFLAKQKKTKPRKK